VVVPGEIIFKKFETDFLNLMQKKKKKNCLKDWVHSV
jgi:hypothetical protein